jgi:hypothetical protein
MVHYFRVWFKASSWFSLIPAKLFVLLFTALEFTRLREPLFLALNSECILLVLPLLYSTYALQPSRLIVRSWLDVPNFRHQASPRVSPRESTPAAEGGTVGEKCPGILPKCQFTRYIQGSFTCRKATTWDQRLYFPSEGRRAEDFFLPQKSDGFGRVRTRELGYQKPARYL